MAAIYGELELVRSIISATANLNIQDDTGATALMWATHRRHHGILELLLNGGVDRTLKNQGGLTALNLAEINRDKFAIDLLAQNR